MKAAVSEWQDHAQGVLSRAGYRASAPRAAVVGALSELGCSVTAKEIADLLDEQGQSVGLASIYRASRPARPHAPGEPLRGRRGRGPLRAGAPRRRAPSPPRLARAAATSARSRTRASSAAIEKLSRRVDYAIDAHDVTLRGECPACHARA